MCFNLKLATLAIATTVAVASFGAQASSIDVKVTGTITPGSCVPTLTGGGTFDYGKIGAAEVDQAKFTSLPEKSFPLSISCDAPTKVAIKAIDNRLSSVVPGAAAAVVTGTNDNHNFGLGTVAGFNVGGYIIRVKQNSFTADGTAVSTITSTNSGTTWQSTAAGVVSKINTSLVTWKSPTLEGPVAFKNLSGTFSVQAFLNKGSELTLTDDVPLDGSATLELVYL